MAIKAKYLEDPENPAREFYNDIPARDLDEDEYAALTPEQQERVRNSHIYRVAGAPPKPTAPPPPARADTAVGETPTSV